MNYYYSHPRKVEHLRPVNTMKQVIKSQLQERFEEVKEFQKGEQKGVGNTFIEELLEHLM
jgi:hypothetical protein